MNLLCKALIVTVIGCGAASVSAMQKSGANRPVSGNKQVPGSSGNIGKYIQAKYCAQPQPKPESAPVKKDDKADLKK